MRAGLLNKVVTILEPVTINSEYGGAETKYESTKNTKARVVFNNGERLVDNSEIYHSYTISFEIRNYHKVNEDMRIKYKDKQYRILSVEEQVQSLILKCELVNE